MPEPIYRLFAASDHTRRCNQRLTSGVMLTGGLLVDREIVLVGGNVDSLL